MQLLKAPQQSFEGKYHQFKDITVEPLTEQLPEAEKLTANPELADAVTEKSASPYVLPARAPKVTAWSPLSTVSVPE